MNICLEINIKLALQKEQQKHNHLTVYLGVLCVLVLYYPILSDQWEYILISVFSMADWTIMVQS